jgi:hypothetical protein
MARHALFDLELSACEYQKAQKLLVVSSDITGGFPDAIRVVSHHTGKVVLFEVDVQAGIDHEFWDGEMCEYVPVEATPNVTRLVVSNFH